MIDYETFLYGFLAGFGLGFGIIICFDAYHWLKAHKKEAIPIVKYIKEGE